MGALRSTRRAGTTKSRGKAWRAALFAVTCSPPVSSGRATLLPRRNDKRSLWHTTYARPSLATILLVHLEYTIRFFKRCEPCNEYHRGKLRRTGPLHPVIAGASYERWYIDLTGPHPRCERGHVYILTCVDVSPSGQKRFHSAPRKLSQLLKCLSSKSFVDLEPH